MRDLLQRVRDKRPNGLDHLITFVVVLSGLLVGLQTVPSVERDHGTALEVLDGVIVLVFVAELALKVALHGRRPWRYFKDGDFIAGRRIHPEIVDWWHVFDFAIVVG